MAQQSQQHSFLSVSCGNLDSSENQLATMWGAFTKCKPYIENGTRLENMSWRLWQYQRQPTNYIDNTTIKRFITSVLLSPVNVHDAYSHEVAQPIQKCCTPTTTTAMAPAEPKSATSSFVVVDEKVKADDMQAKEQPDEQHDDDDDAYEDDEYEDDEDYYLSDDLYDDEDDDLYDDDQEEENDHVDDVKASRIKEESQFNHDFRKMQPRPTTPRRSLLSDLLGRVSSPPSLLSNSTCSFTTNNSLTEDESSSASSSSSASTSSSTTTTNTTNTTKYTSKIALNTQHHPFTTTNTTNDLSEIRWRESFHGW
ncbi:hypothetical protein MBANPS3_008757 [Mucor bainieri]